MSDEDQDILTLKIAGIDYQLFCPPEEQSTLIEAGESLDKRIKSIKRKTRNLPLEKVAVLAGLDLVNEFLSEGVSKEEITKESPKIETAEQSTVVEQNSENKESEDKPEGEDALGLKLVDEITELSKL